MKNFEKFGDYLLLDNIGLGGFAETFLAVKNRLSESQKIYCIKRVKKTLDIESSKQKSILLESKILSSLNHPNVVSFFESGTHEGNNFIAMEFVEGLTINKLIKEFSDQNILMDQTFIADLGRQVAAGLDYIHHFKFHL